MFPRTRVTHKQQVDSTDKGASSAEVFAAVSVSLNHSSVVLRVRVRYVRPR